MLAVRGRVNVNPLRLPAVFEQAFSNPAVSLQPLTPEIGIRAAQLSPGEPMDPADQLIAATALVLGVPLITSDVRRRSLPGVRSLWSVSYTHLSSMLQKILLAR